LGEPREGEGRPRTPAPPNEAQAFPPVIPTPLAATRPPLRSSPPAAEVPQAKSSRAVAHPERRAQRRAAKPSLPTDPPGLLTLETHPWTDIYLGGRKLGTTPLFKVPVPSGHQRLRAVNTAAHIAKPVEVDIPPNELVTRKEAW